MIEQKTLKLKKGITRGDKTITDISLTEPNAGHLRGLKLLDVMQLDIDSLAKLLPRISTPAMAPHEVYQLSLSDLAELTDVMGDFMEASTQSPTA